jgi:hypothetical protein
MTPRRSAKPVVSALSRQTCLRIILRNDLVRFAILWGSHQFLPGLSRVTESRVGIPAPPGGSVEKDGQRCGVEFNMEAGQSDFTGSPRPSIRRIC